MAHVPYSFETLISQVKGTITGEKLIITSLAEASLAQTLWLIESTGQMNSSLFSIRKESRRMERVRLTSHMNAVERVLATSHGGRAEVRRLASANADLCSLYRDLVTPQPRKAPHPVEFLKKEVVFLSKEKRKYGHSREDSWDLAGCVLLPGTRKPKCARLVARRKP